MKKINLILRTITVIAVAVFFTSCSGLERMSEDFERGEDLIDASREIVRSTDRLVRSGGRLAEQSKESGQEVRGLKKKQFNLELIKSPRLEKASVRVRLVGTDKFYALSADDFVRYRLPVSRFVDSATMTIYTEINGTGIPIKVRKEYRKDIQSGSTESLVLIETEDWFAWIPASERGQDQEIIFSSN